jgi:hypothetical protein
MHGRVSYGDAKNAGRLWIVALGTLAFKVREIDAKNMGGKCWERMAGKHRPALFRGCASQTAR